MQHIHWLGTGLSSIPGIRRLAKNYDNFTIWNRTLERAEHSINHINKHNVVARKFDLQSLSDSLNAGDVVVSQLPASHHLSIAKFTLFSLICVRIDEIEVKHITPNEDAIAICIA